MNKWNRRGFTIIEIIRLLMALATIGIIAFVIWVVIHFVLKLW